MILWRITCAGPRPRGCANRACLGSLQGHVQAPLPAQLCCRRLHRGHAEGHLACKPMLLLPASRSFQKPHRPLPHAGHWPLPSPGQFHTVTTEGIWCAGPWAHFKLQREVFTQQKDAVQGKPASKHLREKEGHESRSASVGLGAPGTPGRAAGCRAGSPARRTR